MLTSTIRLCPNTAEVAAKILDGEAILINLSDGMYYSMDRAGGLVWEQIEARHSLHEIATEVSARYEVPPEQATTDVQRLARELLDHRLVLIDAGEPPPSRDLPNGPNPRLPYEPVRLNAYHDMAELLALDPPHPTLSDTLSRFSPDQSPR